MAVRIVRDMLFEGKTMRVGHYQTEKGRLVTPSEKVKADEVDDILAIKCKEAVKELERRGLLKAGKKRGLETWYNLGKLIDAFFDELPVRPQESKLVYRAFYNHLDLVNLDKAARKHPEHSHYSKCHQIAQFDYGKVSAVGNWSQWYPLLENAMFANGDGTRLLDWLYGKVTEGDERIKGWKVKKSRIFNKKLTPRLNRMVSIKDIPDNKLYDILEEVADEAHEEYLDLS